MGISIEEVRRVAALAKLEFEESELETFALQLSAILDYVERLRQVDTEGAEPDLGGPVGEDFLRPDEPLPCLDPREAVANAPEPERGHFRVPRVIG